MAAVEGTMTQCAITSHSGMCEPPDFYTLFPSSFMPPAIPPVAASDFLALNASLTTPGRDGIWYVLLAPPIIQQI